MIIRVDKKGAPVLPAFPIGQDKLMPFIDAAIAKAGGKQAFADKHGFSTEYLRQIRTGKLAPADRILEAIGFEKVVQYRIIRGRR